jgi:DNA-binding XRE family transcriptional regulator
MQSREFKVFRKKLEKTQKQISQLLGTSIKAIHSYEQGWRSIPVHVERQLYLLLHRKLCGRDDATPCWEALDCPQDKREACPAWEFASGDLCWFISGTICDGAVHHTWQEKMELCHTCDVFKTMLDQIEDE